MAERDVARGALPLPPALTHAVLALLSPADRGRCACVSRALRDAAACPSLWTRLVVGERDSVALLNGAAAKAKGALTTLDVRFVCDRVTLHAFKAVFLANAASLLEASLLAPGSMLAYSLRLRLDDIAVLIRAAPLLRAFHADVRCEATDASAVLRGHGIFRPLRVRRLEVGFLALRGNVPRAQRVLKELLPYCAAHPSLEVLALGSAFLLDPVEVESLVELQLSKRLLGFGLCDCAFADNLMVRVLLDMLQRDASIRSLDIRGCYAYGEGRVLDDSDAAEVAAALAESHIEKLGLPGFIGDVSVPLLAALAAHPSLEELMIIDEYIIHEPLQVIDALGAVVAADAPSLLRLHVELGYMDADHFEPLFGALSRNTHLRELTVGRFEISPAFIRDVLQPVVRANSSLRKLDLGLRPEYDADDIGYDEALALMDEVARRP